MSECVIWNMGVSPFISSNLAPSNVLTCETVRQFQSVVNVVVERAARVVAERNWFSKEGQNGCVRAGSYFQFLRAETQAFRTLMSFRTSLCTFSY